MFYLQLSPFVIYSLIQETLIKGLWIADRSMIFEGKSFSNLIQVKSRILTMEKKMNKTTLPKLIKKSYSINLMYPAVNGHIKKCPYPDFFLLDVIG
jgi:hypothetical protein